MSSVSWAIAAVLACATVMSWHTLVACLWRGPVKYEHPYQRMDTVAHGVCAGATVSTCVVLCDAGHQWWWLPLAVPLSIAAYIDGFTRLLPLRVHYWACGTIVLAVLVRSLLASEPEMALRACAGFGVSGVIFWLLWRWAHFGFGDVRLAAALGTLAAADSWTLWYLTLLLGTIIGALWGLVSTVAGGRAFAYGPSLVLGSVATVALQVSVT